ncbi:hypothetical protein ACIBI4_16160 [Streptomyces sp. NPDC050418]|uniref:hypothetical protein n=1 Tax=Streptomyces sp. NPDC050418 TaxID=3365612 RepID=UPI00379887F3
MLDQALIALASAAGVAVAQAAGTDAWQGIRERVARLFGRGPAPEAGEDAALARLDRTAAELEGTASEEAVAAAWETRFRDLLADAGDAERAEVAQQLRELVALARESGGQVVGEGITVTGDVHIDAQDGSVAGLRIGNVTLGNPRQPGTDGS